MINYYPSHCLKTNDSGEIYREVRHSGNRLELFPMRTAVIAYDSRGCYIVGTLFYEALARGLSGGKDEAERKALELQPNIERFVYDYSQYITRTGFVSTLKRDVYILARG